MTSSTNYLVSYGANGQLGCFVAEDPQKQYQRGNWVLVRSDRGQEAGLVLCEGGGTSLPSGVQITPGLIIKPLVCEKSECEAYWKKVNERFEDAQQLFKSLFVPMQLVDVELIIEPATVVLHVVQFAHVDLAGLEKQLWQRWQTNVLLHDITNAEALEEKTSSGGGCGSCSSGGGGCGSGGCGEGGGGGCSTGGGCQSSLSENRQFDRDWRDYFAELRQAMERRSE